ncbi:ABC transporter substrate-binding protein [Streptomyces sp. NPDC059853]|uniref:ABC transporter substrate-binding protein n=1 Tax=Streptomyces sp. NPDC059853 TaxID=3346973 RepID=UPI00366A2974
MTATTSRTPLRRLLGVTCGSAALALALTACGGDSLESGGGDGGEQDSGASTGTLTIGGGDFTEATIMAELYSQLLTDAGYTTEVITVQSRELYAPELEKGSIDIVPEYAATLTEFLNVRANGEDAPLVASSDPVATVEALRELATPRGLTVLDAGDAVNQNAFAVTAEFAEEHGLTTLSDLGASGLPIKLAAGDECPERPFCQPGLEEVYGIDITGIDPKGVGTVQAKQAVKDGTDDLVLVSTTDGTLDEFGLVLLEDDQNLQLADNLLPVLHAGIGDDPEITDTLNRLTATLTTEDLVELNRQVDAERLKAADVAGSYLQEKGLLGG